jgi:hypothetical protein
MGSISLLKAGGTGNHEPSDHLLGAKVAVW